MPAINLPGSGGRPGGVWKKLLMIAFFQGGCAIKAQHF
jgi:hypothetical protein